MPKTPDEIKKGLVSCISVGKCWTECPYFAGEALPFTCIRALSADALALIQQLEADKQQLEGLCNHMNQLRDAAAGRALKMEERAHQLEAERDAAVDDLETVCGMCSVCCACKDRFEGGKACRGCVNSSHWHWRGVQKEE